MTVEIDSMAATKPNQRLSEAVGADSEPAIFTVDLTKQYGKSLALRGLTMSIQPGEVFGFLGPNGAGKTTAVKLLVGLSKPTGGEGRVLGEPLGSVSVRRRVGYLPELFRYQDWLSANEVLEFQCRLARIPKERRKKEIGRVVDLVGLVGREHDRVGAYSKGMQQRLGLGVALLGRPQVVFLDEPTSALDPVGRHDVREIIRTLKSEGTTVFLNSHLLTEIEQVCDRVAVVHVGRVIAEGTTGEIRGAAKSVVIRATGLSEHVLQQLQPFGATEMIEGQLVIRGAGQQEAPEIVRLLVENKCQVYSVDSSGSLEQAFLNLIEGEDRGDHHDSRNHTA